ncbi:50S ribosomal protein L16 [Candidatus Shapirobacteria bacterium CG06_land_8_20_14_3_00_40_12]|uniref:Large ribosomal subunit protein uL16 n=2 Tax=Candidatus Shapironibacteriota TaxID=1752721 RepID=A0A2M7TSZ1_9BACT|nr:MAG: 50S ribosomal protein L16 [Candidatus Shapirobacteria bacterium CG06_land_8_20_14_3_00_40_12]PIZ58935.1 MAG: 50S ribosomal protein L16 [Candidatus Shapirobacteria bacterium CG_4_10_14_0_2_um_filter_40_12]
MLQPGRTKYRKAFRGRMRGLSAGSLVNFGDYGLKAMACGWVTSNQIEAARRTIAHATKRNGRMWIRIFPDKPVTEKAGGGTMGAGKGDVKGYVAVVRPGRILFEITGVSEKEAHLALKLAGAKLPIVTKIVSKI